MIRDLSNRVGAGHMGDAVSQLAAPAHTCAGKRRGPLGKLWGTLGVVGMVIAVSHAILAMLITFYTLTPNYYEWGIIILAIAWAAALLSVGGYALGMSELRKINDRINAIELHCKTKFGEIDDEMRKIGKNCNETGCDSRHLIDKVEDGPAASKAAV